MKLFLVLLLALPGPALAQATPPLEYPDALLGLLPGWLADAERAGRDENGAPLSAQADEYLQHAREAAQEKRFRVATFHLDTHRQLVETERVLREVRAAGGSPSQQRDALLARTDAWHAEALEDWAGYRRELDAFDDARSLRAVEMALFSADLALSAAQQTGDYADIRSYVATQPLDAELATALVRATRGASYGIALARDVLPLASAEEGVPPLVDAAGWDRVVRTALAPVGEVPEHLAPVESVAGDARANDERILAVALQLADVRQARVFVILQQYADAAARGKDVVADAATGLTRALENVTREESRDVRLRHLATLNALDQGRHAASLAAEGGASVESLAFAWAEVDRQAAARVLLLEAAGGAEKKDAPGVGLAALAGVVAVAALALRRR